MKDEYDEIRAACDDKIAAAMRRVAELKATFDCGFADAQEQAAKVCDGYAESGVTGAMVCAAAIRAMKVEK